jgi:hypothetical protein
MPWANSSVPLTASRLEARAPWKGSVKSTMSQPSWKNSLSEKNHALNHAGEAPKPWTTNSVGRGPSTWRQCWAWANPLRPWRAYASRTRGLSASYGLAKRSTSTRPRRATTSTATSGGSANTAAGSGASPSSA